MTVNFSKEQKAMLEKIGVRSSFDSDMSVDEVESFVDKVSEYLQLHGLSDNGLNKEGQICEDILNLVADV